MNARTNTSPLVAGARAMADVGSILAAGEKGMISMPSYHHACEYVAKSEAGCIVLSGHVCLPHIVSLDELLQPTDHHANSPARMAMVVARCLEALRVAFEERDLPPEHRRLYVRTEDALVAAQATLSDLAGEIAYSRHAGGFGAMLRRRIAEQSKQSKPSSTGTTKRGRRAKR